MVIEGKLIVVMDTVQTTETFKKRSFVVELIDNPMYPQKVQFEVNQDRVSLLDNFAVGDQIEVVFNLRGREWTSPQGEKKYFNTLEAWRIQKPEGAASSPASNGSEPAYSGAEPPSSDDLPW